MMFERFATLIVTGEVWMGCPLPATPTRHNQCGEPLGMCLYFNRSAASWDAAQG
jgi:hypothetical protein